MISRPKFTPSEWDYTFVWQDEHVRAVLERFGEARGEIWTELTIDRLDDSFLPQWRLYGPAKFNLLGATIRVAPELREVDAVDWTSLLTQVRAMAVKQYREGSALIDLSTVELSAEVPRFLLPPFVDEHGVSVLVADGGAGKSITALAMAVSVATATPVFGEHPNGLGPVAYLDWEADEATHAERLRAICAGIDIPVPVSSIHYQRMVSSLPEAVASLRKRILDAGARMVVVDSIGMARGGAPESAEETIKLFRALRSISVPVLAIDHVSKEAKRNSGAGFDPIGSIYTRNSARLVWAMEGKQFEGSADTVILFRNMKANFGGKERQRSYRYQFTEGPGGRLVAVSFTPVDWRDTEEFQDRIPVKDRILRTLRDGRMDVESIAAAVEASADQVRARVNELKRSGYAMRFSDGTWGLLATPTGEE